MNSRASLLFSLFLVSAIPSGAQELYRAAQSSFAQATAGASTANTGGPMDAMATNPAGLTQQHGRALDLGVSSVLGIGRFTNAQNTDGRLDPLMGIAPFGAFQMPLVQDRLILGLSVMPDTSLSATWHYNDSPGTAGADYGYQRYRSSMLNLRPAVGLGYQFSSRLSVGATAGIVYNANTLQSPYIFQTQPVVAGLKTLLDMHTHGTGWNGSAGVLFSPSSRFRLGASYRSRTVTHTSGTATGSLTAQLAALGLTNFDPTYAYHAKIDNTLPQVVTAGASVSLSRHAELSLEADLVDWRHAFNQLPVRLSGGTNSNLNSLIGSSAFEDTVPLHWADQGVYRAGLTVPVKESVSIGAGFAFANDPVPTATLTPLTAAITREFLTTGASYHHGWFGAAFAYEAGLPQTATVGKSELLAGEYSNSKVDLTLQSVSVTTSLQF